MDTLTDTERAAIRFYINTDCKDKSLIFKLAKGADRYNRLSINSRRTTVYNWFSLPEVKEEIKKAIAEEEKRKEEFKKNYICSGCTLAPQEQKPTKRNNTNFLDRDEFLQFLNDKANDIQDDKLRNDILKMLSDNLRYKDTERDENNEIMRFYIPLTCKDCKLYQDKRDGML